MPLVPVKDVPSGANSGWELHLDLGSIKGESASSAHPEQVELRGFSWSGTNTPIRTAGGTGASKAGRPSLSEMTVVKGVDKATTGLWYALYSGQAIKTATISLSKSTGGKKPEDYFTMTLSNVFVSSIHLHSGEGESGMGTESVTLSYDSIDLVYKRQGADGLLTNAGVVSFSLAAGK